MKFFLPRPFYVHRGKSFTSPWRREEMDLFLSHTYMEDIEPTGVLTLCRGFSIRLPSWLSPISFTQQSCEHQYSSSTVAANVSKEKAGFGIPFMSLVFHCQLNFRSPAIFLAKLGSAFYRSALFIVSHGSVGQSIFSNLKSPKCHCSSSSSQSVDFCEKFFRLSHFNWASLPGCFAVCLHLFRYSFPLDLDPQPSAFRGSSASHYKIQWDHQRWVLLCSSFLLSIPVFYYYFIYLASSGLSCGAWDLSLQRVRFSTQASL